MGKFTLEFGPIATARLEEIAKAKELSRADVVRRALEVYSDLLEATATRGSRVVLEGGDGTVREMISL